MDKKKIIEQLLNNKELNIVVVGPDYNDGTKNKLRIYAMGGRIGRIYVGKRNDGKSELIDLDYCNYCSKLKDILDIDNKENRSNEEIEKILISEDYLKLVKEALSIKWKKKSENEKERDIETKIVKNFMKTENDWAIIDMEVQCPKEWLKTFIPSYFDETKQPRFDLIVLNNQGLGIIELKVNNENCENLKGHYEHMAYIQRNPDLFIKEMNRRIKILHKNELISDKTMAIFEKQKDNFKIWCGFLFVGGGIEKSQKIVKDNLTQLNQEDKAIKNFKYLYCEDIKDLNLNEMILYKDFIALK